MPRTVAPFDFAGSLRSTGGHVPTNALAMIGEAESRVSRALADSLDPQGRRNVRGFYVPLAAMTPVRQARDLTTSTGSGAVAIPRAPADAFTDVLRRKAVLGVLGAEFVSLWGGNGPVRIPAKSQGVAAGWVAEGDPLTPSNPEFDDDEDVDPKTVGASVVVSRYMWKHAGGEEFQNYLVAELGAAIAAEVDRAAFVGEGGEEPTGLLNLAGVPTASLGADGGVPTRAALVDAMKAVHKANGDSPATARMGWATNPDVEARLRLVDGGMGDGALWRDDDRILGRPAAATTSIPNDLAEGDGEGLSALAYGNWADVLVNHAPAAFVIVNPYRRDAQGDVVVTAFLEVRILFRHVESFVVFKDVQTA